MESLNHTFKNSGELINNDTFLDRLFELENHLYVFSITPKTNFWRFGIRLSKTSSVEFFHPSDRYKSPEFWNNYADIHLGVGEWDNANWSLPNRFHLVQYNLSERKQVFPIQDTFSELGKVEWKIRFNPTEKKLDMSYKAEGCEPYEGAIKIPDGYKYFKVFAWADKTDYELQCDIKIFTIPAFWLLKLNPDTIDLEEFYVGESFLFKTNDDTLGSIPDRDLFFHIQTGDQVLGYALGDYQSIFCQFEVVEPVKNDPVTGEHIRLRILNNIKERIPLDNFRHKIPPTLEVELTGNSPIRLLPLDRKVFQSISAIKGKEKKESDYYEENVELLNDSVCSEDLLTRYPFVNALADYIDRLWEFQPNEAYTIHLSGEWGSGKSNILSFLERRLEREKEIKRKKKTKKKIQWLVVRYNAWENQHINPPWWVFLDNIYHGIQKKESFFRKKATWLKEQWWRAVIVNKLYWIAFIIFGIATWYLVWHFDFLTIWTGRKASTNQADTLKAIVAFVSILGTVWIIFKGISSSLIPGSSEAALNFQKSIRDPMETVKKHFGSVIGYTNKHVAILVDDIDRCSSENTVKLLEGIQTLFKSSKVLYIVSGDGAWIKKCFELHYDKFKDAIENPGYKLGDFFLEKIFQMNIRVPFISKSVIKNFWKILIKGGSESFKDDKQKEAKIKLEEARQNLKDKVNEKAIDEVVSSKTGMSDEIYYRQAAIEQISNSEVLQSIKHRLEEYTEFLPANPRALKRLVNNYALSRQSLILQGVSLNKVGTDALVRWLILNSKFPEFADKISKNPSEIQNTEFAKVNGFLDLVVNHLDQDIIKSIIGK